MRRSYRLSIAGMMGVVLVSSLSMAALKSPSPFWAGLTFYVVCGLLTLGVVGVVCGGETARAWWLGFSAFGWGSMAVAFWVDWPSGHPLLAALRPFLGSSKGPAPGILYSGMGCFYEEHDWSVEQVGGSLASLLTAVVGGLLAQVLFFSPAAREARRGEIPRSSPRGVGRSWRRPAAIGLGTFALIAIAGIVGSRSGMGPWAGAAVLVTWGMIGLTAIAASFARGSARAACLGATLFGAGYMVLVAGQSWQYQTWPQDATNRLLEGVLDHLPPRVREFPAAPGGAASANAHILRTLDRPVPMPFREKTTLEDALAYVSAATRGPDGQILPIYVNPIGLQEAEKTMHSPVILEIEGVPLRTTLRLLLRQLGLGFVVRDGLIEINSDTSEDYEPWNGFVFQVIPSQLIGHCVLAWLAAGLGAVLAPLACVPREVRSGEIAPKSA